MHTRTHTHTHTHTHARTYTCTFGPHLDPRATSWLLDSSHFLHGDKLPFKEQHYQSECVTVSAPSRFLSVLWQELPMF